MKITIKTSQKISHLRWIAFSNVEAPADRLAKEDMLPSDKLLIGRMMEGDKVDMVVLDDDSSKIRVSTSSLLSILPSL